MLMLNCYEMIVSFMFLPTRCVKTRSVFEEYHLHVTLQSRLITPAIYQPCVEISSISKKHCQGDKFSMTIRGEQLTLCNYVLGLLCLLSRPSRIPRKSSVNFWLPCRNCPQVLKGHMKNLGLLNTGKNKTWFDVPFGSKKPHKNWNFLTNIEL